MSGEGEPAALFAYGTLQVARVVRAVLGRVPAAREAEIPGFARRRVAGAVYPGLCPKPGAVTPGLLYTGLAEADWPRLDAFEGRLYERRVVRVRAGGPLAAAQAYVVPAERTHRLTDEPWELERFIEESLPRFLGG